MATRYFHETFGEFDFSSLSWYDVAKMYWLDTKIGKEKFWFEWNMEEAAQLIEDDMFGPIRSILHSVATSDNDLRNKSEQIDIENKKIYTTILEIFLASLRRRNPDGCENCYYKWTRWRVPMFEFVYCDKDIQNAILTNVASEVMDDMIKKKNVFTLERYWIMWLTRSEIDLAEFVSIRTSSEI